MQVSLVVVVEEEVQKTPYKVMSGDRGSILFDGEFEEGLRMDATELRRLLNLGNRKGTKRIQGILDNPNQYGIVKVEVSRWRELYDRVAASEA